MTSGQFGGKKAMAALMSSNSSKPAAERTKTPLVQRIVQSSRKTPTSSPSTDFRFQSPSIASSNASVPINDDEAERRRRRLENQRREFLSPGGHTPRNITSNSDRRRQCSSAAQLSNAQIADHYKQCIKLSSENKINSRNAFGLHLIDYMEEMLRKNGEMTNFQVAGCTLDAGAKIYAGRVDSIYNDAFKMLGGLGRGGNNEEGDVGEEGSNDGNEPKKKSKKNPPGASVQTIEKNTRNLDVATFDLEFEVDPLYKRTAAAFDEGGIEGLLLNHLRVKDDRSSLVLDSSTPLQTTVQLVDDVEVDMRDVRKLLASIDFSVVQMCPTFAAFTFQQDAQMLEASSIGHCTAIQFEQSIQVAADADVVCSPSASHGTASVMSDGEGVDYHQNESVADIDAADVPMNGGDVDLTAECVESGTAQYVELPHSRTHPHEMEMLETNGALCLTEALQDSEYGYFKSDILSAWAGPQHWKVKTSVKATSQVPRSKKEPKKAFRIDFSGPVVEAEFLPGKASIQLSKAAVQKMTPELTTLPHDNQMEVDALFRLFLSPELMIARRTLLLEAADVLDGMCDKYADAMQVTAITMPMRMIGIIFVQQSNTINCCRHPRIRKNLRADNLTSLAHLARQEEYDDDDDDDNGCDAPQFAAGSTSFQDTFMPFVDETRVAVIDSSQLQPTDPDTKAAAFTGDNLVAQPKKAQPLAISYARVAKRIDVKKVKGRMWSLIETSEQDNAGGLCAPASFQHLCENVSKGQSESMAKNLSVPICFVCLLHLANEKTLFISGQEDMADLSIHTNLPAPQHI